MHLNHVCSGDTFGTGGVGMKVAIAGTGIIGLTAGIALKSLGAEVLLYEQAPEIRAAGASIGIWENALQVYDEFGAGQQVRAIGTPIEAWFYDAAGNRFRAPGFGVEDHSFVLMSRPVLNEVLADAAGRTNIFFNHKVTGFKEDNDGVTVEFADGTAERADLLIGADGVYSAVRNQLVPGFPAKKHVGHHVWRAMVPSGGEPAEGSILTVGHERTRGGFARTYGQQVTWMVNQFDSPEPSGNKKEEALKRANHMNDKSWGDPLIRLIESTPEDHIIHTQIMFVPTLPHWTSKRVVLMGDAAHGLSPHISAGGTLGIEDVLVFARLLQRNSDLSAVLAEYEQNRLPQYKKVHELADAVERTNSAQEYALEYARFSHWMLNEGAPHSRV
jgi:2-polyprenyl-6-methoxyphenol hydroxylase-like FAD-dependent oxidoreductase